MSFYKYSWGSTDSVQQEKSQRSQVGITIREPVLSYNRHLSSLYGLLGFHVTDKGKTKMGCHSDNEFSSFVSVTWSSVNEVREIVTIQVV